MILTPESLKLTPESEFDSGVSYTWRPSCEPFVENLRIKEVGDKELEKEIKGNRDSEMRHCNLDEISEPRKGEVRKLIEEYEDFFSKGENDLGRTVLVNHEINTQGADPVYQRA